MPSSEKGLFIVWRIFQRRSESLARCFDLEIKYYYADWEEKSKFHKALSYVFKTAGTLRDMIRCKPEILFIQLPPTPVLYLAATYCYFTKCRLVADCHNAMIYSKWLKWPFALSLLRNADAALVHNEDVEQQALRLGLKTITLRDPLPQLEMDNRRKAADIADTGAGDYVMVPWSFSPDEPIEELFQAAESLPAVKFLMTWFAERLPQEIRDRVPSNLVLTGYLDDGDFNALFSQASAVLVMTTREGTQPSAASEAIVLGVPLIVSDLQTTRRLYEDVPVYIANDAAGISEGVRTALATRDVLRQRILGFKNKFEMRLKEEIDQVEQMLALDK